MPPHLHPRSRLTSSLFATTLFASFFVVALPHVLPCPAPRVAFADDGAPHNGNGKRRRRRKCSGEKENENVVEESGDEVEASGVRNSKSKRECPVPKPGGIVGEILGFKSSSTTTTSSSGSSSDGKGTRPP